MDFTLKKHKELLSALQKSGFVFQTFDNFLKSPKEKSIILRHDVDLLPKNSLVFAKIQAELNIKGSYYFRAVPESWDEDVIKEIGSLGHEIGYHYECLTTCNGDFEQAIKDFEHNLAELRKLSNVSTICMHGSPKSKWDSKDLWDKYDYRDYKINGEPYFDLDFKNVFYLTDTGRRWNGAKFSVRDKVNSFFTQSFNSTQQIIDVANNGLLPSKIMFNFHPQRWTDNNILWTKELISQNLKNQFKRIIVKRDDSKKNMSFLFYLGHPAHFHLFINVIRSLKVHGYKVIILIKKKDILEELLIDSKIPYLNILPEGRKDNKAGIAFGVLKRDLRLLRYCLSNKPSLMIGTSTEIAHIGCLFGIPSIIVNEDDADVVPLFSRTSYPWSKHILSPRVCKNDKWDEKTIKYDGYHELAYLHPNHFTPSREVVEKYFSSTEKYFIIRFAKLTAHHDTGINGISNKIAKNIIQLLEKKGKVYITSERELDTELEKYRININPLNIHHVMAYAHLYIGDSQTMAAESGVLGIPFIRFNDFVGRISYLAELEDKYQLGYGIKTAYPEKLFSKIEELLKMNDLKAVFQERRMKMLSEKIDVAAYMKWLFENYPKSLTTLKENPEYPNKFITPINKLERTYN